MESGKVLRLPNKRIELMESERQRRISSRVSKCLLHMERRRSSFPGDPSLDGEFRWVREIAKGSFCSANLIQDKKSGKTLVMKITSSDSTSAEYPDPLGACSLGTEIRALTRILSQNTPKIHAHNLTDGEVPSDPDQCELYCIMDFVQGETLLEAGPKTSLIDLFKIAIQLSQAMEAAHDASVCHRDITEDNVMVRFGSDGAPVSTLVDFGLAKILPADPAHPDLFGQTKVPFPSDREPAAIRFDDMDERSDIYMLGLMIALNSGISRGSWRTDPGSTSRKNPGLGIPSKAVRVIAKAMESDPKGRFQSAREFRSGLESALHAIESEMIGH